MRATDKTPFSLRAIAASALFASSAAVSVSAATPPPPPGPYSTVACVTFGLNVPGCPGHAGTAGAPSSAQTGPGLGPVYSEAAARPGSLSMSASVASGALYLGANAGAAAGDYLYIDDPLAADSTWVPVQVTLKLSGSATYSAVPSDGLPFAGASFAVDTFGPTRAVGVGTGRYENYYTPGVSFAAGLYNRTWMPLTIYMSAYAGVDRFSQASSVSVTATGSIFIQPLSSGPLHETGFLAADESATRLYSASGHDYAPVPEPASSALMLAGLLALFTFRRSIQ